MEGCSCCILSERDMKQEQGGEVRGVVHVPQRKKRLKNEIKGRIRMSLRVYVLHRESDG